MIKHNKVKNTAFLYECLTRQITSDVLSNIDPSPALAIVKEFFKPTTILGKELVLYKALTSKKLKNEGKINYLVDSVLRERKQLKLLKKKKKHLRKKMVHSMNIEWIWIPKDIFLNVSIWMHLIILVYSKNLNNGVRKTN
jgi:hypothetical protein